MCDTFVVMPDASATGEVLFGKNSDRDPNEAHEVTFNFAKDYNPGERLKCTYIEIDQVPHTYTTLLSKPFWIWGAEMGANEFGLAIGNEAVFTRLPYGKEPGLIGMDYLRLALERSRNAMEGVQTIVTLLERYGQSGNCGFMHPMFYHNAFLLADPNDAWVLETAGNEWAAVQVKNGVRTISNRISIDREWDRRSAGLISTAMDKGWCKDEQDFEFSRCYSDLVYTTFSDARKRQACTTELLLRYQQQVRPQDAMAVLRGHGIASDPRWSPDHALTGADVCMHAGFGPIRINQTTGSMVSALRAGALSTHWVTGTAAPCLSLFKPVWMDGGLPDLGPHPTGKADPDSLWWRHEVLHRKVILDYATLASTFAAERDAMEARWMMAAMDAEEGSMVDRNAFTTACFAEGDQAEARWIQQINVTPLQKPARFYFRSAWEGFNRDAGLML